MDGDDIFSFFGRQSCFNTATSQEVLRSFASKQETPPERRDMKVAHVQDVDSHDVKTIQTFVFGHCSEL